MTSRVLALALAAARAGCPPAPTYEPLSKRTLVVEDPRFGPITREYVLHLPAHGKVPTGSPLALGFHGQGGRAHEMPSDHALWSERASENGWITAYPQGLADFPTGFDSGWNVGTNHLNSTCLASTPKLYGDGCHESCAKLDMCSNCCWSTCYDDVAFVQALLASLEAELCLDTTRYFAWGESNGAMMVHYLSQRLPGTFAGVVPYYGLPLLGQLVGPDYELVRNAVEAARTSLLQMHDRSDATVPWQGGASADGWLYEPLNATVGVWAALHGCSLRSTLDPTPYDPSTDTRCYWHAACRGGARVGFCLYDGEHGDEPRQRRADRLVWDFVLNVSRAVGELPGKVPGLARYVLGEARGAT